MINKRNKQQRSEQTETHKVLNFQDVTHDDYDSRKFHTLYTPFRLKRTIVAKEDNSWLAFYEDPWFNAGGGTMSVYASWWGAFAKAELVSPISDEMFRHLTRDPAIWRGTMTRHEIHHVIAELSLIIWLNDF